MAQTNFFKLEPVHQVVSDFVKDHATSILLWQQGIHYLKDLDTKMQNHQTEGGSDWAFLLTFYREISGIHLGLQLAFDNLHMSYYAFRKTAETDKRVGEEFKKLPPDFTQLQTTLNEILQGYETALQQLKQRM